jgi:hypothetical protein
LGILLYRQNTEEIGLSAKLDRLAGLLADHTPDRLAAFWRDVMGKRIPAETTPETLSEIIIRTIRDRGMTAYAVGKASGVDISIIQRFLAGERDLNLKNADLVCRALGLVLTPGETKNEAI